MRFQTIKRSALFITFLLLAACSQLQQSDDWLSGIPDQTYFRAAYQADEENQQYQTETEYLGWIRRFYTGLTAVPGWLGLTERLLERVPDQQRGEVSDRLYDLGGRIGSEWAKDNRARSINTRMANVWRDALLEALAQEDLDNYLDILDRDVALLRAGELEGEAIYFERYYVDEFDF